jgi:SAM-dependent methyltransferase
MYEQFGRYYAFFGPQASVTTEEKRFLRHWTEGRRRALDFGAGLCGPAVILAEFGLEVFAFEPAPVIAILAMDRLNRDSDRSRSITLLEGHPENFSEKLEADFILMRSVLMLLNNAQRRIALRAVCRHAAPGARIVLDVRTLALPWADDKSDTQERSLGHTLYKRTATYERDRDGSTEVRCVVDAVRHGRTFRAAEESFTVRADAVDDVRRLLAEIGFEVSQVYGAYDLDRSYEKSDEMIVVVARDIR